MSDRAASEKGPGWADLIRSAPLGVLILCALLFFLGAGFVLGGFFLAFARRDAGWMPWMMALAVGPTVLYLSVHLLLLTSWSWLALVGLLGLLLASSVVRAFGSGELVVSPLVEIALEGAWLFYLTRRRTRRAFGWA